ncbi:MAG: hypothetical protein WC827_04745, partial [Candidatus Paceibacterota bacterium]
MNIKTKNYIYFGIITLFIVGIFISANSSLSNPGKNNTAYAGEGIVDMVMGWLGMGTDDNILNCTKEGITLACSTDAVAGCFCEGGVLGNDNIVWEYPSKSKTLLYDNAKKYCTSLGAGWKIPKIIDLDYIYELDGNISSTWFPSTLTAFWTKNPRSTDDTAGAVMTIKSHGAYEVPATSLLPVICVKDKGFVQSTTTFPISITAFSFANEILSSSNINQDTGVIQLTIAYGMGTTDITHLTPMISLNRDLIPAESYPNPTIGESIYPELTEVRDFTNSVTYTITASDGTTKKYVVSVSVDPRPETKVLNVTVEQGFSTTKIVEINKTIKIYITSDIYMSSISTIVTISRGSFINPLIGSVRIGQNQDEYIIDSQAFDLPQRYTVSSDITNGPQVSTDYMVSFINSPETPITIENEITPTVSLSVSPSSIYELRTTTLTWSSTGATKCTAIGGDSAWPGNLSVEAGPHSWTTGMLAVDR